MTATDQDQLKIFAGRTGRTLATAMCRHLDLPLGQAETKVFPDGELLVKLDEDVRGRDCFVLCGDGPLIRADTLRTLLQRHLATGAAASLATSVVADATGYGRIQRDAAGRFQRIVEQKDATEAQRAIREINPSYYLFRTHDLFDALTRVTNQNASGEYYITDVFELLLKDGKRVEVVDAVPPEDVLSVNTPEQLAEVDAILRRRLGSDTPARSHA